MVGSFHFRKIYGNRRPISCNEYRWFLDAIYPYLDEQVDVIQEDTEGFNELEPSPLDEMIIRTYCRYYRIAHEAFIRNLSRTGSDITSPVVPESIPLDDRDILSFYIFATF